MALTLIYDDGCGVCRSIAQFIGRRDRQQRIALAPLSASDPILRQRSLAPEAVRADVHLIGEDGSIRRGISVVQPVLAELAFWRRIAPLFKIWPLSYLLVVGWLLLQQVRHQRR